MDSIRKFLISENEIVRDTYIWNMVSNLLFAFQSVIILIVLTRAVGLEDAGVFTIAYANASLFLIIGKYGVRNFQVSDMNEKNSFKDYQTVRAITTIAMLASSVVYAYVLMKKNDYSFYKCLIVILMCIYKMPDVIEDVYFGEYQRKGRLDVAAKCMTIRLAIATFSFMLIVCLTKDLLCSLIEAILISFISMFFLLGITINPLITYGNMDLQSVKSILMGCLPLFIGLFLAQYITTAPKYSIDYLLTDDVQACYGFISMPVFVIGLLSSVIFNPIIHKMATFLNEKRYSDFFNRAIVQVFIVIGLTIVCIIGAAILGIPVLSIMYSTDLSDYKKELIVLLIGGGFLALSNLFNVLLTIMRCQYKLLYGYVVVAIVAFFVSNLVISTYGVMGASILYTGLMAVLALMFIVIFVIEFRRLYS